MRKKPFVPNKGVTEEYLNYIQRRIEYFSKLVNEYRLKEEEYRNLFNYFNRDSVFEKKPYTSSKRMEKDERIRSPLRRKLQNKKSVCYCKVNSIFDPYYDWSDFDWD